jgi:prepilin-type N-terminal cleavage/methylation domain-containing protein
MPITPHNSFRRAYAFRRRSGGFTLIELLVVIGIIVLIMGLALPALIHAMRQANRSRTEADLHLIETALDAYKQDFGDYPRFDDDNSNAAGNLNWMQDRGARLLCRALIAPGPAVAPPGRTADFNPSTGAGPDGADGPGFRVRVGTGGKTYGPYIQPDKFKLGGVDNTYFTDATILDSGGNPILYYPAAPGGTHDITAPYGFVASFKPFGPNYAGTMYRPLYNAYDNAGIGTTGTPALLPVAEMQYILGDHNINGQIDVGESAAANNAPYLLWSAGADGIYGRKPGSQGAPPQPGDKTDDVTNFEIPSDLRK